MSPATELCNSQHGDIIFLGLAIVWQLTEYWLGKTRKVKAGSIPELLITAVATLVIAIFGKKDDSDGTN